MCSICNCFSLILDLIQRILTFVLSCWLCVAVFSGFLIAIVAGVAYGYNYSIAEFLTLSPEVSVSKNIPKSDRLDMIYVPRIDNKEGIYRSVIFNSMKDVIRQPGTNIIKENIYVSSSSENIVTPQFAEYETTKFMMRIYFPFLKTTTGIHNDLELTKNLSPIYDSSVLDDADTKIDINDHTYGSKSLNYRDSEKPSNEDDMKRIVLDFER